MQLLNTKSYDELITDGIAELKAIGFSTRPGAVAKLFLNIVNKNISDLYKTLTINHLRSFVTTSDGAALNAIGVLLKCTRLLNETDDNYRSRITKQCLVLATSNQTAVYLTALTVDGIENVVLKELSMGSGSFTVIIVTSETDSEPLVKQVKSLLNDVHGYGIRFNVITPTLNPVKLKYILSLTNSISDIAKQEIKYNVQANLLEFLSELDIGETIYIKKLAQIIMNTSPNILSFENMVYQIKGETSVYVNQESKWFERFICSSESDAIVIL